MAEALFRAAKGLQAEGKLAEACPKFVEAHRLDPKPGSILNVATCHELEGRTATAWADFAEAATLAARAHQLDREHFARNKVVELSKRLSYVMFRFPDVAGLEVVLDGKVLTTASAGTRVPMDPGEHEIGAHAPHKVAWSSHVKVEPGPAEKNVVVPPLVDETASTAIATPVASAAGPPAALSASGVEPAADAPLARDRTARRFAGWLAVGAGAVGFGAGSFFGLRTLSKKATVDDHCVGSHCDVTGLMANDDAKSSATVSTVAFAVGGALLVTGVVLLLTGRE